AERAGELAARTLQRAGAVLAVVPVRAGAALVDDAVAVVVFAVADLARGRQHVADADEAQLAHALQVAGLAGVAGVDLGLREAGAGPGRTGLAARGRLRRRLQGRPPAV